MVSVYKLFTLHYNDEEDSSRTECDAILYHKLLQDLLFHIQEEMHP